MSDGGAERDSSSVSLTLPAAASVDLPGWQRAGRNRSQVKCLTFRVRCGDGSPTNAACRHVRSLAGALISKRRLGSEHRQRRLGLLTLRLVQRVLIIDDEESILNLLELKFRREGLEVVTAATVADGLEAARQACPDLIIVDVQMRDAGGETLAERLRENASTAHIPLILLSARADEDMDEEFAGMIGRLRKPFRPSQLLALARDYL